MHHPRELVSALETLTLDAARVPIVITLIGTAPQPHAVGHLVARLHLDRLARHQVVLLDEAQEGGILIGDARHVTRSPQGAGEQGVEFVTRHVAVGRRDGVAVRVHLGPAEHLVDALDEAVGHDVLQLLRLVVHLVPAEAHHAHQEQLDQPVPAQHQGRQLLARRR